MFLKEYYLTFHRSTTSSIVEAAIKMDWQNEDREQK